ncbi:MAG: hypothetical protein A3F68_11365 [Acidobacteria bacterium RIFCSPLOWO2_12_FULL_54_10]|nr:MAG: hypothetical protein A3F68_11365 [Acidobacteria bacterium RIFCSPLOWO2_12_FULL_54_10]
MPAKYFRNALFLLLSLVMVSGVCNLSFAQAPDMVVVNAKLVTMDDEGFTTSPGTIAEAMAIRGGRITAVGSTAQIRAMASGSTRVLDMKGKMVLPGVVITHEHPSDWDTTNPWIVKKVIPEDVAIHVFTDGPVEQQIQQMEQGIRDAVKRAKPGQWIRVVTSFGKNFEYYNEVRANMFGGGHGLLNTPRDPRVLKDNLDKLAPNNPVMIRNQFTGTGYNTKAMETVLASNPPAGRFTPRFNPDGTGSGTDYRLIEPEVILRNRPDLIYEMEKVGIPWLAGYGITTWNSSVYSPNFLKAYKALDRAGLMAVRFSWLWGWWFDYKNEFVVADMATRVGEGSDTFWFGGLGEAWGLGSECSTLVPLTEEGKNMLRNCSVLPGSDVYESTYQVLKAGGRLTGFHTMGDADVDNTLELIEKASRDGGLSEEDIRAKRHGIDHGYGSPRPDQAQRMARLGMVMGMTNMSILERPPLWFKHFGEAALNQIVPRKTAVNAKLMNSMEIDRPLATSNWNVFDVMIRAVTRESWDGKRYGVNQALNRVEALKTGTIWGAYYTLKEKDMGSLEPGKFADFIVIDKDYLTIPEDQLDDVNVLMTVVGGKTVHLVPSLARDLGMQPAGPQVELGSPTVANIP